jgi:hypothetical protein
MSLVFSAPDFPANAPQISAPVATGKAKPIALWAEILVNTARFYANKLKYVYFALQQEATLPEIAKGPVRQARTMLEGVKARLPYCLGRDGRGILCGVQPAWMYLDDFAAAGPAKERLIRRLLARLPGGVSFHFAFHSGLADGQAVRRAFAGCGFKILEWQTYVYTPPASHNGTQAELIDTFSGKSIKGTLRRAMRDMEIVDISVADYIGLQRANLRAEGKKNTRNDTLDQLILEEAVKRNCARIFATRRKSSDAYPGPHPIDAALVYLWDEDRRISQLWRLTYRQHNDAHNKTHVDASKLLVLAAMQDAAERKYTLDTDGYTPGMAKLYGLFGPGVFRLADRLHCERECLWASLSRYYPGLMRRFGAGRLRAAMAGLGMRLSGPAAAGH